VAHESGGKIRVAAGQPIRTWRHWHRDTSDGWTTFRAGSGSGPCHAVTTRTATDSESQPGLGRAGPGPADDGTGRRPGDQSETGSRGIPLASGAARAAGGRGETVSDRRDRLGSQSAARCGDTNGAAARGRPAAW
jgi:hypothetical protein